MRDNFDPQKMKLSSSFLPFGVAALAFALGGCNSGGTQSAPTSSDSAPATNSSSANSSSTDSAGANTVSGKPFVVAYNQWIGFAGVLLAQEKGYFKEAGLDVQLKQFPGPADGVPSLIAGQIDAVLTTADTPILLSKSGTDNPLQNVMVIDTSNGADGLIAQKGIASMADLKGKTIGATKGQVNEFLLLKALQSAGMSEKDVAITNMDPEAAGAAVLAGKIPAAVTWEPWLSKAGASGGKVIFSSAQTPNLILDVATVSQKTATTRSADVRAFVAACLKGNELAIKNPQEAAKIAEKSLGTTQKDALAMLKKVKLFGTAQNKTLIGTAQKPGSVAKTSDEIAQFFVSRKVMSSAPANANLFTADFLPQ